MTTFEVADFVELEPTRKPEPEEAEIDEVEAENNENPEEPSTEQLNLFEGDPAE